MRGPSSSPAASATTSSHPSSCKLTVSTGEIRSHTTCKVVLHEPFVTGCAKRGQSRWSRPVVATIRVAQCRVSTPGELLFRTYRGTGNRVPECGGLPLHPRHPRRRLRTRHLVSKPAFDAPIHERMTRFVQASTRGRTLFNQLQCEETACRVDTWWPCQPPECGGFLLHPGDPRRRLAPRQLVSKSHPSTCKYINFRRANKGVPRP